MALEDFQKIRRLREEEANLFAQIAPACEAKRIILYSMDPWQLGAVEQLLHVAFQLKGHQPKTLYDDGLLPLSAWENHYVPPPQAGVLEERSTWICGAFGITPVGISSYLDGKTAREQARALVDAAPDDGLRTLNRRGIPIGELARRDLFQYTVGHFEPRTAQDLQLYREHLVHAIMSVDLANAIITTEEPDIVVLVNGKAIMYTYMYELCRLRGIQVTTWEEGMYWDTSIVLANNARAIDFPISDADWCAFRELPFDETQHHAVEEYFDRWRRQEATYYVYYDHEMRDFPRMRRDLHIQEGKRLISIFSNIVWDTNALGKDQGFDGMMDWIFTTINYVHGREDCVLVIRAHPGEAKWKFKTRTPIRRLVMERFNGQIPQNVRIVDGVSEFSSYEIAAHSDCCAVYTSTLGIELAMMGLQPLICGVPFYSDRGFSNDVPSKAEYFELLGGAKRPTGVDTELLLKFMYLTIFKLVKRPEFLTGIHSDPQCPHIEIDTFEGFPESMPVFNGIVRSILENRSFIDLEVTV